MAMDKGSEKFQPLVRQYSDGIREEKIHVKSHLYIVRYRSISHERIILNVKIDEE